MQPKSIISQVIKLYPTTSNKKIAKELHLTPNQVRTIANHIGRTYWSVVYKISELRKKGLI